MTAPVINQQLEIVNNEQYVELPRDLLGSYTDFTVLVRFKVNLSGFTSYVQYNPVTLCSVEDEFSLDLYAGQPALLFTDAGGAQASEGATASIAGNIEHVAAAVYDSAAQTISLYLDGALLSSSTFGTIGTAPQQTLNPFRIARRDSFLSNLFDTIVYEVRFYKDILSLSEIQNYTDWPTYNGGLVFFVGGDATRDAQSGELTQIEFADVPEARREELRRIIVKYKPIHSWGALLITSS